MNAGSLNLFILIILQTTLHFQLVSKASSITEWLLWWLIMTLLYDLGSFCPFHNHVPSENRIFLFHGQYLGTCTCFFEKLLTITSWSADDQTLHHTKPYLPLVWPLNSTIKSMRILWWTLWIGELHWLISTTLVTDISIFKLNKGE